MIRVIQLHILERQSKYYGIDMEYTNVQREILASLHIMPNAIQQPILISKARQLLIAGGERSGKSMTNSLKLIVNPGWFFGRLYWLVGNDYEACRGEWNHLVTFFSKMGQLLDYTKNIDPGRMVLEGGVEIVTKSAKYPTKIATIAPDGILVCEAAQIDFETYLRLRGRIAEKRAWMSMAGTFESSFGWYPEYFTRWQSYNTEESESFSLPTWSNTDIFPGGRTDPEILKLEETTTPERFKERYGGEPCPPAGLVVKEFSNQIHVGRYEFDDTLPVEITVDPGYAGAHVVEVIQSWGEQIVLIDEIYLQGYITSEIIDICKQKMWWSAVTGGTIDIAAKQHQAMDPPIEVWLRQAKLSLRCRQVGIEDGIEVLRSHMKPNPVTGKPVVLVNARCKGFISECGGGKSPVIDGGPWLRDDNTHKPIDKNNHAAKAMIYYLINKFGYSKRASSIRRMKVVGVETNQTFVRT